jgi:thiamine pyrophosphate-dependent acetolactate synthase large subunit-like protein
MVQTAADVLVNRLVDWGVRVVFGLPGDGINGIMEVMCRSGFRLRAVGFNNKVFSCGPKRKSQKGRRP